MRVTNEYSAREQKFQVQALPYPTLGVYDYGSMFLVDGETAGLSSRNPHELPDSRQRTSCCLLFTSTVAGESVLGLTRVC